MNEQLSAAPRSTLHAPRLSAWQWAVAVALLLALFFQLTRAALRNSVTFDEGQHIARGYAYLKTGDLRFQRFLSAHPPGMAILEAAPLLLLPNMPEPSSLAGWSDADTLIFAKQLVWKSPHIEQLMFAARVPVMLVTLLLAAFVFRWASDLSAALRLSRAEPLIGLIAMSLCAFDPNMIAHGMLATTDLGVTAFSFMALYWLWKGLRRPSPGVLAAAGFTLGLALMAKMTALLLLPVSALLILALGMSARRADYFAPTPIIERIVVRVRPPRLQRLLGLAVMAAAIYVMGFLVVWAMYHFEVSRLPSLPIPIPAATHLTSVWKAEKHLDVGHPAFLMGQVSEKGWWYYFPVAFLIKTPISLLILLGWAIVFFIWRGRRWTTVLPPGVFVGAYALIALLSAVTIGYRHLLPLLPCLFVLAAQVLNKSQVASRKSQVASPKPQATNLKWRTHHPVTLSPCLLVLLLLIWQATDTARLFPNYLTFFNELVGGPRNGYKYLVDSNLDWGQSLIELRSYLARNNVGRINLSATGFVNPAVYGIAYDPLPPMPNPQSVIRFDPRPGRYYIGAHNLQIGSPIDHDVFGWFREREPVEWIADAILVYDVPQRPAGKWVAQCAAPQAPLEPEAIAEGFGRDNLRLIYFDCRTSWVFPAEAPGWYVVGADDEAAAMPFRPAREFRTGALSHGPQFTVYRLDALPDFSDMPGADARSAQGAPVSIGPLTYLGFGLDRAQAAPGQTVVLWTWWRVTSGMDRLVSLMAHLVAQDGRVIANGDGLGVSVENWQPGDVFVQQSKLIIPRDMPPGAYQVQTGAYTLDDLRRFDVVKDGVPVGDRLLLSSIEVRP